MEYIRSALGRAVAEKLRETIDEDDGVSYHTLLRLTLIVCDMCTWIRAHRQHNECTKHHNSSVGLLSEMLRMIRNRLQTSARPDDEFLQTILRSCKIFRSMAGVGKGDHTYERIICDDVKHCAYVGVEMAALLHARDYRTAETRIQSLIDLTKSQPPQLSRNNFHIILQPLTRFEDPASKRILLPAFEHGLALFSKADAHEHHTETLYRQRVVELHDNALARSVIRLFEDQVQVFLLAKQNGTEYFEQTVLWFMKKAWNNMLDAMQSKAFEMARAYVRILVQLLPLLSSTKGLYYDKLSNSYRQLWKEDLPTIDGSKEILDMD
eukprot:Clim_evm68s33 gene=Clim_evmTU68s33